MEEVLNKKIEIDKSNWQTVKFGDVVFEPKESSKDPLADQIEHVVGLEHITSEDLHLRNSNTIEESTTFTKKFAVDDVLFGRRRAYLKKAAQAKFSGICSGDITVFRAKENLLPDLLPFIVHNDKFFDYAIKHSAGGLSPRVKFKDLANYEFLLPPKDQQAKLAELLWAMDEVIESDRIVLHNAESTRLSTEKTYLAKIDIKNGINSETFFDRVTDGTHDTPKKKNEGYRLLTSKNIINYSLDLFTDYFISENDYNEVNKRSKPDKNDILFGMIGTVGQVCRILEEPNFAIKNMGLFKTKNPLKSKIAFHYFKSRQFQFNLNAQLSGTTQKYVSLGYLRSLKLPNPEDNNVLNWINEAEKFDNLITTIMNKIASSKALQKSLINQVF